MMFGIMLAPVGITIQIFLMLTFNLQDIAASHSQCGLAAQE